MRGQYDALLHRYSGQSDLAVGTPHASRDRSEVEPLIGFFVNTLTLRLNVAGDRGFRHLVGRVREVSVGAFAHREVPFERVVEEVRPERDLARSPLLQVMFILQNAAGGPLALPGLALAPYAFETTTAKFELTLSLFAGPQGLAGAIEYNTDLFDAATVERLGGHFGRLLESLRTRHPTVAFESCASGGGRIDLGVLEQVQRVWTSDNTDALARQRIQRWTTQLVAPAYLGAHVSAPT